MNKLRLVLFEKCNRACAGCCNNDWDFSKHEVISPNNYNSFDLIMLTGGEPLLSPETILNAVNEIRQKSVVDIIVYTAKTSQPFSLITVLQAVDGITVTLHEQRDVERFAKFEKIRQLVFCNDDSKSLRLNIFSGIDVSSLDLTHWSVKSGIEWIKDCPLPENETLGIYHGEHPF